MRVFRVADGSSWVARPELSEEAEARAGWESILFESTPARVARLVYRPAGWLKLASEADLAAALAEAETVRARWGQEP